MDFTLRIVLLFSIIVISMVVASVKAKPQKIEDTFTSDFDSNTCMYVLATTLLQRPENKGKTLAEMYTQLDQYFTIDAQNFLKQRGVKTALIPTSVMNNLPPVKLTDIISKMPRNNNIDQFGNVTGRQECLIPMGLMKQFLGQTNTNTIQMRDSIYQPVLDDASSPFYNNNNKQCKIGRTIMTTNIPKTLTSTNDDFSGVEGKNATVNGFQQYGCILPSSDVGSAKFLNFASEMYGYTDTKTMKDFNNLINQYAASIDVLGVAAERNLDSYDVMVDSAADRAAAEAAAQAAKDLRIRKEAETAAANLTMIEAAKKASERAKVLESTINSIVK